MINEKLKKLRLENKYSQREIAQKLGYLSSYTVYRKERGTREWSIQDIRMLCDLYNISPNYLLSDDEITGGVEKDAETKN